MKGHTLTCRLHIPWGPKMIDIIKLFFTIVCHSLFTFFRRFWEVFSLLLLLFLHLEWIGKFLWSVLFSVHSGMARMYNICISRISSHRGRVVKRTCQDNRSNMFLLEKAILLLFNVTKDCLINWLTYLIILTLGR